MWDSRASQFLVANGFAVVTVNPAEDDSWDAGPWYDWWQGGPDHKFLPKLVDELNSGAEMSGKRVVLFSPIPH